MTEDAGPLFEKPRPRRSGGKRKAARGEEDKIGAPDEAQSAKDTPSIMKDTPSIILLGADPATTGNANAGEGLWAGERNPLSAAFLLTLIFGFLVESFGSFFVGQTAPTFLAAAAMLTYFVYGFARPKNVKNTEQFADSLYYLGFILTLWALFLAMSPLLSATGGLTSRNIIEKFGIAIMTTFVGMTLRILLIQLRTTATDQEEEARESIAQYVTLLNSEVFAALTDIRRFRAKAIESAAESAQAFAAQMEAIGSSSGKAVNESNAVILRSVQQITGRLDDSMADIVKRLAALDVPTDIFAARFKASADALSGDIDQLRKSVTDNTGSFARSLSESVTSMGRISGEIESLRRVITTAQEQLASAAAVSTESASGTQRFAQSATAAIDAMDRFQKVAGQLAAALAELDQRLQAQGDAHSREMARAVSDLKGVIAETQGGASQFTATMVNSATLLRDAINDASDQK